MDLSEVSLEEAVQRIQGPNVFDLHVNPNDRLQSKKLLKQIGAQTVNNPMSPYINLVLDERLEWGDWFLTYNGKAVGSKQA